MKKALLIASFLACFSAAPTLASDAPPSDDMNTTGVQVSKEEKRVLQFDEAVVRKLLKEEGYDDRAMLNMILTLRERDSRLQPLLNVYLKDRSLAEEFVANGTTIKMVMVARNVDFWEGLAYLEMCLKKQSTAEFIREQAKEIEDEEKRRGQQH